MFQKTKGKSAAVSSAPASADLRQLTCLPVGVFSLRLGFQFDFAGEGWADSRPWIAPGRPRQKPLS
jgi:hypothetical protein